MTFEYNTTNLLKETIDDLKLLNLTPEDVEWVGSLSGDYKISWLEFVDIANFGYDSSFGAQNIARDLCVVGKDWWLERAEYDGAEDWEYKKLPVAKPSAKKFNNVRSNVGWDKILDVNKEL